jgi:two-component system cell cycle response regulator DivK
LLESAGHLVHASESGPAGLEAASELRPDLVLLDIQLPGMNGYEVARRLRRDPLLRGIPIVAVTSHAMAGDRELALEAGCDHYIEKPIDPDTFLVTITAVLAEARGRIA